MLSVLMIQAYISATESLRTSVQRFRKNQQGVTAIEYGLIAVAVAILIIAVFYSESGFLFALKEKFFQLEGGVDKAAPDSYLLNFNKGKLSNT
ncbi:fimbrial protein [[Haemophilus] ducreyi]|uniref:Flp family type IVb pilin n=1 Tax=Haemophilus ducreyi TaxID=730 RepID=UPI000655BF38|nr:Flp family type IVb pilin [[Haemophilus] ducreyi]AKO38347.1 fimbrial protein [[Haemophilus] ducreyi]AKO41362.1 fimbrial protein [[Haemophilus] ducreyi]AKO42823.1 fimbrial protein [[Haemophilus] ducreyi]